MSTRYVIRKRLFKHRLKVSAAASVLLVVALMAAAAYVRISRETTKARIIQDYLEYMLKTMDPRNSGGRDVTKELLDKANKELSARFAWEPAMEADIRETLGTNFLSLGHLAAAQDQFQRAVDLRRRAFGAADPQTLAATVNLARAYRERGNAKDAADLCRRAVAACEAALGADHRDTLRARIALAYALNDMSHNEEAEAPIREAWLRARGRWGDADDDTLACAAVLALVLRDLGGENDLNEAEALCQSTLKTRTEKYGPLHADTLESMHDLGTVLTLKGHYTDAEALYHSAIDAGAEILKRPSAPRDVARHNHPDLLVWRSDYAYVLRQLKRHAAAEEIYRQILPASVVARGPAHPYTIILRSNYAAVLVEQEKWAEAEYHCRQANALQDEHWGRDDPRTLTFRDMLAQILSARGQWEESIRIYRETLEIRRKRLPPGDPELLAAEKNVAMVTAFHRKWLDAQTADGAGAANQPAGSPD